jgi:Ca2+-binding RTX toxin-like protein
VSRLGDPGGDTLSGTPGDDVMLGAHGDDTLLGNGGIDVLNGGAGDGRMLGGTGSDTLRLDSTGVDLDLGAIPDTRIQSIEQIDLGGDDNELALDVLEIFNLDDASNADGVRRGHQCRERQPARRDPRQPNSTILAAI